MTAILEELESVQASLVKTANEEQYFNYLLENKSDDSQDISLLSFTN